MFQTENQLLLWSIHSGKTRVHRPITSPENIKAVRASILQSPWRSVHRHASDLGISDRSVRWILKDDLHFHPYKKVIVQKLSECNLTSRRNACEALLENISEDAIVYFSDEAHFHLTGCINKQNMHYCADTNPQELHQRPLHSPKVTVWCAISFTGVVGACFSRKWGHSDNEFRRVCEHIGDILSSTNWTSGIFGFNRMEQRLTLQGSVLIEAKFFHIPKIYFKILYSIP